jgi:hypothetical protein
MGCGLGRGRAESRDEQGWAGLLDKVNRARLGWAGPGCAEIWAGLGCELGCELGSAGQGWAVSWAGLGRAAPGSCSHNDMLPGL